MSRPSGTQIIARALVLTSLLAGCDAPDSLTNQGASLTFEEFLSTYAPPQSAEPAEATMLPAGNRCTAIHDSPPFEETISRAISLVREQVDADFVAEALSHLHGGVQFHAIRANGLQQYSALYRDRTILLFDVLFTYGCLEDVASTLLHEMVHAVQMGRHLDGSDRAGSYNLSAGSSSWLEAELMAEAYQIQVSRNLGWVTADHAAKILRLHNRRRARIP